MRLSFGHETLVSHQSNDLAGRLFERATRIELAFSAWEAFRARRGWTAPDEIGWSRL
jgi:hypothetical protein